MVKLEKRIIERLTNKTATHYSGLELSDLEVDVGRDAELSAKIRAFRNRKFRYVMRGGAKWKGRK